MWIDPISGDILWGGSLYYHDNDSQEGCYVILCKTSSRTNIILFIYNIAFMFKHTNLKLNWLVALLEIRSH